MAVRAGVASAPNGVCQSGRRSVSGNAGDTQIMTIDGTTGYGVVGESYGIGKWQYAGFLNASARG